MKVSAKQLFQTATSLDHILDHIKHPGSPAKGGKASTSNKALGVALFILASVLTAGIMGVVYLVTAYKKIKKLEPDSPEAKKVDSLKKIITPEINEALKNATLSNNKEEFTKLLKENPKLVKEIGNELLLIIAREKKFEIAQILLDHPQFNLDLTNDYIKNLVLVNVEHPDCNKKFFETLLKKGIDPNKADTRHQPALLRATCLRNVGAIEALLDDSRTDLNVRDNTPRDDHNWNFTPLLEAAKDGRKGVLEKLLKKEGVDLRAKDKVGNNIFHLFVRYGQLNVFDTKQREILQMMLDTVPEKIRNEMLAEKNTSGQTPYDVSNERKQTILDLKYKIDPEMLAFIETLNPNKDKKPETATT